MLTKKQDNTQTKQDKTFDDWKNKYLRAIADYQNLEKRVAAQRIQDLKYTAGTIITKLLPVLDVLEKAEKATSDQGIILAVKMFRDTLKSEGVEKIEVTGKKFDPNSMECIEVNAGKVDDTVTEEVLAGYSLNGKTIRVAKVKVGKPISDNNEVKSEK